MTTIDTIPERNRTYNKTDAEIVARFAPDGWYHVSDLGMFSNNRLADSRGFVAVTLEGYLEYHDDREGYDWHIECAAAAIARLWDWQNS